MHLFLIFQQLWQCLSGLLGYGLVFLKAMLDDKATLAARLLAAESQLSICQHAIAEKKVRKPRFSQAFRLLWILLSKCCPEWRKWSHLMQPATVTGWSRNAFQKFWRWKSKLRGRPIISKEMRDLIRQLSKENPLWTPERIGDILRMHGFENVPCEKTIGKYMVRAKGSGPKSCHWLTFLRNHLDCSWAMDLLTVATWNFNIV